MFKIRDVAGLLNVPTVEIHKKLISLKQDLRDHVFQERGITLIDDEGVQIISRGFLREEVLTKEIELSKNEDLDCNIAVNTNEDIFLSKKDQVEDETQPPSPSFGEIVEKNDTEMKRSYEMNALKSEINRLDTEIYKTNQMMQDYINQLGQKNEELGRMLKERQY